MFKISGQVSLVHYCLMASAFFELRNLENVSFDFPVLVRGGSRQTESNGEIRLVKKR